MNPDKYTIQYYPLQSYEIINRFLKNWTLELISLQKGDKRPHTSQEDDLQQKKFSLPSYFPPVNSHPPTSFPSFHPAFPSSLMRKPFDNPLMNPQNPIVNPLMNPSFNPALANPYLSLSNPFFSQQQKPLMPSLSAKGIF